MQLKEDEREVRKALIMDAALELFKRKPFDEIGMRDIAAAAGVSPASIYRYFPSQEELFIEAFIQDLVVVGDDFKTRLEKRLSKIKGTDPDIIFEFANAVVDHLMDNEATFQMMSFLMIKGEMPSYLLKRFNLVQKSFIDKIDDVLRIAGFEGSLRFFSHTLFASILGVLITFRNYPGRSKEEIKAHVHRLAGIVATVFKHGIKPAHDELIDKYMNEKK
jgi:AcrR family transcriptional regulator